MSDRNNIKEPQTDQSWSRQFASFSQGVLFTSSGTFITIVSLFAETMVAVRLLDKASYGIYVLVIAVVNLLVIVVDFGCKTAVTQLMSGGDRDYQAALVNSALTFRFIVMALMTGLIWPSQDLLLSVSALREPALYVAYVPIMLAAISVDELLNGILQGFQAYKQIAISQIIRSLLRVVLTTIFLTVLNLGVTALIGSWIISFAVAIVYQYLIMPIPKRLTYRHSTLKELLRFGFPVYLTRFLGIVGGRLDTLFLGTLAGPTSAAIYEVAVRIPQAVQRLFQSYIAVYFPTIASLTNEGETGQANGMFNRSARLVSMGLALIALGAVLFSREIVTLLFSEKYVDSSVVFGILFVALHMNLVVDLMGYTMVAGGYPKRTLGENTARLIVSSVANLVLIPPFRFVGPAIASLVANYTAYPVAVWLLRRSNFRVVIAPQLAQTGLLLLGCTLFWWLQPPRVAYKLAILAGFVICNLMLTTVSMDDLRLILPDFVWQIFEQKTRARRTLPLK